MNSDRLIACLEAAARAVANSVERLNELDGYAGDGDLGVTMAAGSETMLGTLTGDPGVSAQDVLTRLGRALARSIPSTSGTLIATGFLAAGKVDLASGDAVARLARAVGAASDAIRERGGASAGEKTIVDVLVPVAAELARASDSQVSLEKALADVARVASTAAAETAQMEPKRGRASWMAARSVGHVDAGCALLAIAFGGAAEAAADRRSAAG